MPNAIKTSKQRAFWIPDALYDRISAFVSRHRNAPEDMTINGFVRDALEERLDKVESSEKRRVSR